MDSIYFASLFGQGIGFCLIFILLIVIDCILLARGKDKNGNLYLIGAVIQLACLSAQIWHYVNGTPSAPDQDRLWTYTVSSALVALIGYLLTSKLKKRIRMKEQKNESMLKEDKKNNEKGVLYCSVCGAPVHPGDNFCTECGSRIKM